MKEIGNLQIPETEEFFGIKIQMKVFESINDELLQITLPFMLRNVDAQTGCIKPLQSDELEEIKNHVEKADSIIRKFYADKDRTIFSAKDKAALENLQKEAPQFYDIIWKNTDINDTYFAETKVKLAKLFRAVRGLKIPEESLIVLEKAHKSAEFFNDSETRNLRDTENEYFSFLKSADEIMRKLYEDIKQAESKNASKNKLIETVNKKISQITDYLKSAALLLSKNNSTNFDEFHLLAAANSYLNDIKITSYFFSEKLILLKTQTDDFSKINEAPLKLAIIELDKEMKKYNESKIHKKLLTYQPTKEAGQ